MLKFGNRRRGELGSKSSSSVSTIKTNENGNSKRSSTRQNNPLLTQSAETVEMDQLDTLLSSPSTSLGTNLSSEVMQIMGKKPTDSSRARKTNTREKISSTRIRSMKKSFPIGSLGQKRSDESSSQHMSFCSTSNSFPDTSKGRGSSRGEDESTSSRNGAVDKNGDNDYSRIIKGVSSNLYIDPSNNHAIRSFRKNGNSKIFEKSSSISSPPGAKDDKSDRYSARQDDWYSKRKVGKINQSPVKARSGDGKPSQLASRRYNFDEEEYSHSSSDDEDLSTSSDDDDDDDEDDDDDDDDEDNEEEEEEDEDESSSIVSLGSEEKKGGSSDSGEDYSDDDDEGKEGYKVGGYHAVKSGENYNQR